MWLYSRKDRCCILAVAGLLVLPQLAMAKRPVTEVQVEVASPIRASSVGITPVLWWDLASGSTDPQRMDRWERFERNDHVGHLHGTGGFVDLHRAAEGTLRRPEEYSLERTEEFREMVAQRVSKALKEGPRAAKVVSIPSLSDYRVVAGEGAPLRTSGMERRRGRDNTSNPRLRFTVPEKIAPPPEPSVDVIVVPFVAYFYTHNRFWFANQQWGSPVGGRARLILGIYDGQEGVQRGVVDLDLSMLIDEHYHPTGDDIREIRANLTGEHLNRALRVAMRRLGGL